MNDILEWCFQYTCWNENVIRVIDIEDGILMDSEQTMLKKHISYNQLQNNIQFVPTTNDLNPNDFFQQLSAFL